MLLPGQNEAIYTQERGLCANTELSGPRETCYQRADKEDRDVQRHADACELCLARLMFPSSSGDSTRAPLRDPAHATGAAGLCSDFGGTP